MHIISKKLKAFMCLTACSFSLCGCTGHGTKPLNTETAASSGIIIEPVQNLSDDFIKGIDASSVLSLENSGVKYYDFNNNEQDVFKTLSESGINYIRLRVWNEPYDKNGMGYGGGNNDINTAITLGQRATKYDMRVCIDFHYSDFWADPKRQLTPKAWEAMNADEKKEAIYAFTKESLIQLLNSGVDVGIVQIGNETNYGMCGESDFSAVMELQRAGILAVKEINDLYGKNIETAIHYTNISVEGEVDNLVRNLENAGLDYDIIALSYYPFWHGDITTLQNTIENLKNRYNKKVMIAETSYCYTDRDGDGYSNSIKGTDDIVDGYPATVQGQADMIHDIITAANSSGASGVFYWEGTWIPVGPANTDNSPLWEQHGSGWASSYASEYDPDDAGLYYGGCAWDNQALFDFNGHPLESLKAFLP